MVPLIVKPYKLVDVDKLVERVEPDENPNGKYCGGLSIIVFVDFVYTVIGGQFRNALFPIDVTFGKETDVKCEQSVNAQSPIDVTFGKEMDVSAEQPEHPLFPIDVTFGKEIDVRFEQP